LGPYTLYYEIGRGGMASVYMAREDMTDRLVALKVMHLHMADDSSYVEMFNDEARLAMQIRHANVCAVDRRGRDGDQHYMVQELLAGQTLWTLIQRRARARQIVTPQWVGLTTSIVAEMLDGLHAAHEATDGRGRFLGAVHRDVSPHNVVVQYDGTVRVVDFGIAHAAEREQETEVGVLKGKMSYVAPEQIVGAEVDRLVDVWAAGVTLWEALTGRFLFRAKGALPTLRAVRDQVVLPPSLSNMHVPPALDAVVLRALCRDRPLRPQTAREMAEALRDMLPMLGVPYGEAARSEWMSAEFAPEMADFDRLREIAAQRTDETEAIVGTSGIRAATQLVTMAEILPFEDVTEPEELPPLLDDKTRIDTVAPVYPFELEENEAHEEGSAVDTRILPPVEIERSRSLRYVLGLLLGLVVVAALIGTLAAIYSVAPTQARAKASVTLTKPLG